MSTSTLTSDRIYVWAWPVGQTDPVPAGVLYPTSEGLAFRYADSYVASSGMSLGPEMPLNAEEHPPIDGIGMPGPIRDAAPDAWGRRVILNRLTGSRGRDADVQLLAEATYLMNSGSNRLGALDFQQSPRDYVSRSDNATLDELHRAADLVASGEPLPPSLAEALVDGTTIGGARPKAVVSDGGHQWVAKFSASDDPFSVVGAEAVSFDLARRAGIRVPETRVVHSLGKDVLLSKRFDRPGDGTRRQVLSGLTLLGLGEMNARYGSYLQLLETIRPLATRPDSVGPELFERIAFSIAISNTDDHLRNHASFWDGSHLELTPAYDLSPMNRVGEMATQALAYGRKGERVSDLATLMSVAYEYDLTGSEARERISSILHTIRTHWDEAADDARLSTVDRNLLMGRQILNIGSIREFEKRR